LSNEEEIQPSWRDISRNKKENAILSRSDLDAAIEKYGQEEFRAGLLAGLAVAEKIKCWLTAQPDSARQKQQREWASAAIAEAKHKFGL